MVNHDSLLFADGLARLDEFRLIAEPEQGKAVAKALGERRGILLANHDVVVAVRSIGWAVLTVITLERTIRVQMIADALGPADEIPLDAARDYAATKYKNAYVEEYWNGGVRDLRWSEAEVPRQTAFG